MPAFVLVITVGFSAPWHSHDRFLRDLSRVETGMTRQDVAGLMKGYIRGSGFPDYGGGLMIAGGGNYPGTRTDDGELGIRGCEIYRHSERGTWNADLGIICFCEGRVESIEFSPD